jgi:hypothetical protein
VGLAILITVCDTSLIIETAPQAVYHTQNSGLKILYAIKRRSEAANIWQKKDIKVKTVGTPQENMLPIP